MVNVLHAPLYQKSGTAALAWNVWVLKSSTAPLEPAPHAPTTLITIPPTEDVMPAQQDTTKSSPRTGASNVLLFPHTIKPYKGVYAIMDTFCKITNV